MQLMPTTQEEIKKKAKDKLWDIKAAHILDQEKIKKWLKEEAKISIEVGGPNTVKIQKIYDNALERYASLSDTLEKLYDTDLIKADSKLLEDAEEGVFKQKSPTVGGIWFWFFSLVMSGGLELVFFSYMVFYKGAGPALIGLAVLLLVGGLFTGHGVSEIMIHGQKSEYEETEVKIGKKYIVLLGIGIALIVGVTVLRGVYGGFLAGAVAVFFGLAVTTTESFWSYYKAIRKYYLDKMYRAQQHYAALQLSNDLKEKGTGKGNDDSWRIHYEQDLNDIRNTLKKL